MLQSKIETAYIKHECLRLCQGDILRDFNFRIIGDDDQVITVTFPYIVVLSQDCDLEHSYKKKPLLENPNVSHCNSFLPNILVVPAFPITDVKTGKHLEKVYSVIQKFEGKDLWKPILQNKNERFHFLNIYQNYQVPELILDFKIYQTIPTDFLIGIYKEHYLATVNELFRENLSHRFFTYLSRIALPEKSIEIIAKTNN